MVPLTAVTPLNCSQSDNKNQNRPGRTIVMHKGRAVCGAAAEIVFSRLAAMAGPIGRLRPAQTFLTVDGMRLPRKLDRPAQIPAIPFLAA